MIVDIKKMKEQNILDIKAGRYGTQRKISERLGINRRTIQRWYKNTIPEWAMVAILRGEKSLGTFARRDGTPALVPAGYQKLSKILGGVPDKNK